MNYTFRFGRCPRRVAAAVAARDQPGSFSVEATSQQRADQFATTVCLLAAPGLTTGAHPFE